ncbi:MAG: hypothetical protein ACON35_08400, partial [Candidatus Marinamargulisbacteria bacterium]
MLSYSELQSILADKADALLSHQCKTIDKSRLHVPSPTYVDDVFSLTNRNNQVLRNLQSLYNHGRLAGTGYLSILPVDQGIEHSAGASFAPNPDYFDPENIVKLALEAGCNAVASTYGVLASVSKTYADRSGMYLWTMEPSPSSFVFFILWIKQLYLHPLLLRRKKGNYW